MDTTTKTTIITTTTKPVVPSTTTTTTTPTIKTSQQKLMKASFRAKYEPQKASTAATVSVNAGDFKLRASMTDATIVNGPCLNGLSLAVEKPGSFLIDYNVPNKDFKFQFMNTIRVAEKPLNLTYIHSKNDERTILDGSLVIDSTNKVSVNHMFGTGNTKFKYTYLHGGMTTIEPIYDLGKNTWDFSVSRKVYGGDLFKATYQTTSKNLGLEWTRSSLFHGSFKVSASVNLAEERKFPKLCAETTWDYEM